MVCSERLPALAVLRHRQTAGAAKKRIAINDTTERAAAFAARWAPSLRAFLIGWRTSHSITPTTELSDAGGPARPHCQLTWLARVRSSDLVGPEFSYRPHAHEITFNPATSKALCAWSKSMQESGVQNARPRLELRKAPVRMKIRCLSYAVTIPRDGIRLKPKAIRSEEHTS